MDVLADGIGDDVCEGEENPRAGARGHEGTRGRAWMEEACTRFVREWLVGVSGHTDAPETFLPYDLGVSLCMQPLPSLVPPVVLAGCW